MACERDPGLKSPCNPMQPAIPHRTVDGFTLGSAGLDATRARWAEFPSFPARPPRHSRATLTAVRPQYCRRTSNFRPTKFNRTQSNMHIDGACGYSKSRTNNFTKRNHHANLSLLGDNMNESSRYSAKPVELRHGLNSGATNPTVSAFLLYDKQQDLSCPLVARSGLPTSRNLAAGPGRRKRALVDVDARQGSPQGTDIERIDPACSTVTEASRDTAELHPVASRWQMPKSLR